MYKLKERKGFTLAELLIVVAIIAVLVAVAIPVFSAQLEKSRQATDLANLRSSYAEAMANYLAGPDADGSAVGSDYKMQNQNNKLDKIDLSGLPEDLSSVITASTTLTSGSKYHIKVAKPDAGSSKPKITVEVGSTTTG